MDDPASINSRAARWDWAQAALLIANLAWTTLGLGGYRPETMLVTCGLTAAAVAVGFVGKFFAVGGAGGDAPRNPALWLLPFLGYAALNVLFVSPVPWLGWLDWLGWANLIAVFAVVAGLRVTAARRALFLALVLLALVAVALGCYQRFARPDWLMLGRTQAEQFLGRASGSFGIPNSLAALLLLLLPVGGVLALRRGASVVARVWWGWVTLVLAFGLVLTISRGAWLGLGLALAAWPLLKGEWSWARRAKICLATLLACAGAATTVAMISPAVRERFVQLGRESGELSRPILWRAAGKLFAENPATGTGAGSFNTAFERHRPARFLDEPQWAHNDYLNTLSDYGAIGFVLFFGVAVVIAVRAVHRATEPKREGNVWFVASEVRAALGIGLLAFALQLFVDFHFKIPALALAFAVCAALALPPGKNPVARVPAPGRSEKKGRWLVAALAVACATWPGATLLRAEGLRYSARQFLDRVATVAASEQPVALARAVADLRQATTLASAHGGAWGDLSFALQLQARGAPARARDLAKSAEHAARRALACSVAVPEFWLWLGVALDMQGRWPEAQTAFERALQLAPNRVQAWYYLGYHLALDARQTEAAREALGTCLSLDPGNQAAEALLRRLNERQ